MALSEYESDSKWYFKSVADKEYFFNVCFLVDSVLGLKSRVFYHSFSLFGEIVQQGFV